MRAKRFLEQYGRQVRKIKRIEHQIEALDDLFDFPQDMTSEKVQSSPKPDRIGEIVARKADKVDELWQEVCKAQDLMDEIEAVINKVKREDLRLLLTLRYINLKKWRDVEEVMGFDSQQRWVHKLHGKALYEVEKIIGQLSSE